MTHILVTGASGFVGLALTRALTARGDWVTCLDHHISDDLARLATKNSNVKAHLCEITEWPTLIEIIKNNPPDAILHCAAIVGVIASVHAPYRTMQVNVEGSLNLFEAARLFGIKRIIHMSSEEIYGEFLQPVIDETHPQNPVMAYGISKLSVEHLGRSYQVMYGTQIINMRICWVYGPGLTRSRVPKNFIDAALSGNSCHMPWGADMIVDHTYIDDAVNGILLALDCKNHTHDAYNLASGTATSVSQIVDIVRELVPDADISVDHGEYQHDIPNASALAVKKGALSIERAFNVLGYIPQYDMRDGLAAYLDASGLESRTKTSSS